MLALTAEQYGKTLSPEMVQFYFDGLAHLSIDTVRASLSRHVRNADTGQFMPKVADVIRAADGGGDSHAFAALALLQETMGRVGAWTSVSFADTIINAVVRDMGGWPALCGSDIEEWHNFKGKDFVRRYRAYRERGDWNAPGYLPGYFEAHNRLGGHDVAAPVLIGDPANAPRIEENATMKALGWEPRKTDDPSPA